MKSEDLQKAFDALDTANDLIRRRTAIESLGERPLCWSEGEWESGLIAQWEADVEALKGVPSAEPERLTDEDFETIRIHLNAYKEQLCNQHRWEEAEYYQRIIDRFISFASAQPEIIHCKDCKYAEVADPEDEQDGYTCQFHRGSIWFSGSYCSWAERKQDEQTD